MDEPTTALDVVVQREILQQVEALKQDFGFAVLFITHDVSLLLEFADRIAIMYAGEIVETAPAAELRRAPTHPYTQGLLESFPPLTGPRVRLTGIPGSPPDLRDPPSGCRFHTRCPHCLPDAVDLYRGRRPSGRCCARSSPDTSSPATSSRRARMSAAPLEVREPVQALPVGTALRRRSHVHAVDDVSFELRPGTITALVGESGSGKSTVARLLARLYAPTDGEVLFEGSDVARVKRPARRPQLPLAGADHLPGSVRLAEPGQDRAPPRRAAAAHPPRRPARTGRGARARAAGNGRPRAGRRRSRPSTRTSSPAASGSGSRSPARSRSSRDRPRRRADQHARRLDPHRDPEPDAAAEGRTRSHVPVRHPRPRERALCRRRHPRHVRRPDRRVRAGGAGARRAASPVHAAAPHRPFPTRRRSSMPSGSRSAKGRPPRRSTRPTAAASSRVARSRSTSARTSPPFSSRRGEASPPAATSPPLNLRPKGPRCLPSTARFHRISSGARRRPRTRSKAQRARTDAVRASGIASARRPARCAAATPATSRATSTTATATTSASCASSASAPSASRSPGRASSLRAAARSTKRGSTSTTGSSTSCSRTTSSRS